MNKTERKKQKKLVKKFDKLQKGINQAEQVIAHLEGGGDFILRGGTDEPTLTTCINWHGNALDLKMPTLSRKLHKMIIAHLEGRISDLKAQQAIL